ncbi:hypothetical protein ACHAXA_002923 [Cyclostephanos tholiformis]|uniref:Phosphatidate cytidylyltransferase n=1 Tax=Cyclostephanos tholiformis TaxID=382380 RepID=A0ABD3RXV2_9STRA
MRSAAFLLFAAPWLLLSRSFTAANTPPSFPRPWLARARSGGLTPPFSFPPSGIRAGDTSLASGGAPRSPPEGIIAASSSSKSSTSSAEGEADETNEIARKLKNRNHPNLSRKFTHAGFGIFFACLNQFLPHEKFVRGMGILTSSTLLMELLRYRRGFRWMNQALHFFLGGALRKHEMEGKFTGSFYYFAGVAASAYLFPQTAGTLGIIQLALADPSASYFGRRTRHIYWSRIENGLGGIGRNKGILGFLGGALFCFPFNYRVLKIAKWGAAGIPGGEVAIVSASLLLGLAGAFADLAVPTPALTMPKKVLGIPVPPFHVDDNFVVPICAGWACTKIFRTFGWDDEMQLAKHIIF